MIGAKLEIPETWDTVKYKRPLYPTFSRGKIGVIVYSNSKYHCYGVRHSEPFSNLTQCRERKGFGFCARSRKCFPFT